MMRIGHQHRSIRYKESKKPSIIYSGTQSPVSSVTGDDFEYQDATKPEDKTRHYDEIDEDDQGNDLDLTYLFHLVTLRLIPKRIQSQDILIRQFNRKKHAQVDMD